MIGSYDLPKLALLELIGVNVASGQFEIWKDEAISIELIR